MLGEVFVKTFLFLFLLDFIEAAFLCGLDMLFSGVLPLRKLM